MRPSKREDKMAKEIVIALIDGYIDDPAALGVPPYISPMIRSIAGAALDAGADRVEYISIDMIRKHRKLPDAAVSVVLSGNTVPGKYLRTMPMSLKELSEITPKLKGWKMISGSAADSKEAEAFDFIIKKDPAASLYDGISGKEVGERYRTLEEWNRWMMLGADIVTQHQDFPEPLMAEIESYRGCHRYKSGGCSYCIEPLKGKPLMRSTEDILAEARRLRDLGVKNIRIGGQTCIVSFGSEDESETPRPNPEAVRTLFEGLHSMGFDTIHVDNANPAVISTYPEESEEILRILADNCTDGNVLALGMESADPFVVTENNLNSTSEQVMDAVRLINMVGSERGDRGMPKLLPGINIICGLDGETKDTYRMDMEILERMKEEGLMIRRINIRQVLPVRRPFEVKVDQRRFKKFKEDVRENIDQVMLQRIVPYGTILKDVYMELNDGNTTFGRQIGSYPLLVGVPYKVDTEEFHDVFVTDWGFRSITGITYPFDINHMPMSSLAGLPGIGKKRASKLVMERPFSSMEELAEVVEDPNVMEKLKDIITLG
jgi:radical SAM superfamily enzyme with C-terminal helix-hairpin-helix motif